jgi:S-DNA-T family DNA segregation ATPase FtsK/SpoIIIE
VLDQNGAEVLMGQGDMLFLPPGSHKLVRAQGTLLEDDELHRIIEFLAAQARPEYHPQLMRIKPKGMGDMSERDPMFDDAVKIVLESKRGSVSLLQRRLSVGYSRASRLIEQMAEAGIVGDFKGSQAREVVITEEDWDSLRSDRDQADAADEKAAARQADRPSAAAPFDEDASDEPVDDLDDDGPEDLTEDSENDSEGDLNEDDEEDVDFDGDEEEVADDD